MKANTPPGECVPEIVPSYAPLVRACARFGIGRTTAFQFARDGQLETFKIGARTFVMLDSLESLPQRLAGESPSSSGRGAKRRGSGA